MNKILFGAIIALMLVIAGIGAVSFFSTNPSSAPTQTAAEQTTDTTSTSVSTQTDSTTSTSTSGTTSSGITMATVMQHNSASSCYTAINGSVYDVTSWINQHPGGAQAILSLCGTDGSAAFNAQHGGQARPANELASFKIGALAQ